MREQSSVWVLCIGLSLAGFAGGCAGNPVAPFDDKNAPIMAYRLQNYEPPPVAAAPTTPGQIPGLPPEIQKWVQAGASMLPPGLLPPGILPGTGAPVVAAPVDNTQRFHNFRVLGMPSSVIDPKLRDELTQIFGFEKNFDDTHGSCVYAEFGFSIGRINQPPADILVSLSCDQVQATNFAWPHKNVGLTPETAARISKVSQSIFGG